MADSAPNSPTISDLARALNLSVSSVSYALNGRRGVSDATRKRVLDYAAQVGYAPNAAARALSGAPTACIGVVIRENFSVIGTEPYYLRFMAGAAAALEERGIELIVKLTQQGLDSELAIYRRWASQQRVDGVLLLDEQDHDPRPDLLRELRLPAVLLGTAPAVHSHLATVIVDDSADAQTIVAHLADQGVRRVLHAAGPERHRHEMRRMESIAGQCQARGLEHTCLAGGYLAEDGAQAAQALRSWRGQGPDAIVAANDVMAVGACRELRRLGLDVPGGCRVVAWDSSLLCEVAQPAITALQRAPERQGARTAALLMSVLEDPGWRSRPGRRVQLPNSPLVVRGSSMR